MRSATSKRKILHAIQPMSSEEVLTRTVRGQYGEGIVGGERVPAYRSEPGVPPDSKTETFVAMKLLIDNWRWADVPFYLRTGKRLPAATPISSSSFAALLLCCSATRRSKTSCPTNWCCTFSRRKAFHCASPPRFPGQPCGWARST